MTSLSTRDAYGEMIREIGNNENIVVLDADLSVSTKTSLFAKRYPERFFNVGCAEQNLIGVSAGFALGGKTVFASTYAIFAMRAWEQIRNTVAHDRMNVKIVVSHSGLTNAADGASHQSLEDIAAMRIIPNMRVICPADAVETRQVIKSEIALPGPAYIRLARVKSSGIFDKEYQYSPDRSVILREGDDIGIVSTGTMTEIALEAEQILKERSISASIVHVPVIKPIDTSTITAIAKRCGSIVTIEEHTCLGGLGSAVAETLATHAPVPMRILGTNDVFGESGEYYELLEANGLTPEGIVKASCSLMEMR